MQKPAGILSALWTPTTVDGEIDDPLLKLQVEFVIRGGVAGILALGSTGEFVHFDLATRERLLRRVVELANGHPVVANISDVSPRNVRHLARVATDIGCAGVAILPPWYFPLSAADQQAFFLDAASATPLPICLYNFPERTGNRISLETIAAVSKRANVTSVKQSGAEWAYHQELVALGRELNFAVLTGSDTRLDEALALGCTGCISGLSNVCPELLVDVCRSVPAGDATSTARSMSLLKRVGAACGGVHFPMDVAAGMRARGLNPGAPKQVVSEATRLGMEGVTQALIPVLRDAGLLA